MARAANGFSLIEMLVALSITLTIVGAVFGLLNPSQDRFAAEPERTDLQQRLRVGQDAVYRDLLAAGAGPYVGNARAAVTGPLFYAFPPVLPFIYGVPAAAEAAGDSLTVFYVPPAAAHTSLAADLSGVDTALSVDAESGCPGAQKLCRFAAGTTVLLFDEAGQFDALPIAAVDDEPATLIVGRPAGVAYRVGARVVQGIDRTYHLKTNVADATAQLMVFDGSTGSDAPVVDHVVGLAFEYLGDPQPPTLVKPLSEREGPWTTYGPKPPAPGHSNGTSYPPGENCIFSLLDGAAAPRLPVLGDIANPSALVQLEAGQLTDGPWCPDPESKNRWDADLLRIRKVAVRFRVEAAVDALRGPASALFSRAGTSRSSNRWVPDREFRFQVSPRNLNLER